MHRLLRDEAGSSAVEAALVAPVIVAALLWSLYLTELGLVRIRQQEASRFLTWEMASHELQDFDGKAHEQRFALARRQALAETRRRYANLQGHDVDTRARLLAVHVSLDTEGLEVEASVLAAGPAEPTGWVGDAARGIENRKLPGNPIRSLLAVAESTQRGLLSSQGLNVDQVGASTRLVVKVENLLLPTNASIFPERLHRVQLAPALAHLRLETWALADGSDVDLPGDGHPFWRQVDRTAST